MIKFSVFLMYDLSMYNIIINFLKPVIKNDWLCFQINKKSYLYSIFHTPKGTKNTQKVLHDETLTKKNFTVVVLIAAE